MKATQVQSNHSRTILLVEDETIIAMSEASRLRNWGYSVTLARTGAAAVATVERDDSIDLVLMDIHLGTGMDGTDAAQAILERREVPIVFLTNHCEPQTVAKVKDITRYGYVLKSSGDFVLRETIATAFELYAAHAELAARERRYRALFEGTAASVTVCDREARFIDVNHVAAANIGKPRSEIIGRSLRDIVPEKYPSAVESIRRCLDSGEPIEVVSRATVAPRGERCFRSVFSPISMEDDEEQYVQIVSYDVTATADVSVQNRSTGQDHYLKEELYDLVRSDPSVFEFIQAGSLDGIWYWDLENPEQEWLSPRFWEVLGYDPAEKRHLASEWQDLIHPDDLETTTRNFHAHLADPSHPYDQIVRYRHKDGSQIWVRCRGIAVRRPDGTPIRLLGAHNEITKLKETERQLRDLLDEKTSLLQEVNHRVKNNLAAVSSLVNLKNASLGPETDLSDIKSHIEAIQFVYEQLSQSNEADTVEIAAYISGLVAAVFRAQPRVSARVDIDRLSMRAREATALGLMVNELAMNAMKHGLVDDEPMEFRVSSTSAGGDGELAIEVSNTGRPISDEVQLNGGDTLGLRLVSSLAKQLGGSVAMRRADAAFTITLPKPVAV